MDYIPKSVFYGHSYNRIQLSHCTGHPVQSMADFAKKLSEYYKDKMIITHDR